MLGEDSSDGFVGPTLDRRRSGPNEQATVAFAGNLVLPGASHDTNVDRSRSRNRRHEATLPPHPGASSPPITEPMVLAGVAAAVLWPLYGALLKRWAQDLPPLVSTCYFLFYTAVMLVALSVVRGEPLPDLHAAPWTAHAGLLYLAVIGSVLAWTVYLWLLQRLDLSVLSTLGLIQPIIAVAIDLILGTAQLRLRGYLGASLVLLGMALSAWRRRR